MIQWRLATLNEAKAVVTQYHKYLSGNSLINTVVETDVSVAPGDADLPLNFHPAAIRASAVDTLFGAV